jgi:hypothetical protein
MCANSLNFLFDVQHLSSGFGSHSDRPCAHMLDALPCRLEAAVIDTYIANDKSVLTPDVGGTGNNRTFTDAVCSRL